MTVAAQATQVGEIKSDDCVPPEKANLIDLGIEAEAISQPMAATPRSTSAVSFGHLPARPAAGCCVSQGPASPQPAGPSAAGSSAKDVGGSPEKAATDLSSEHKLNKSQQLKKVFKECGAVGVSLHVGISLVSLGTFYLAVSSGVDMTAVLFKLGFSESSLQSKRAAGTSAFVLAYAIHKLFAPVRISITIVSVPFIVRYCWKIVFFKPPTPNLW
ncbi:protein FAM210B, mitochondrial-like [Cygnus olor]|uniref:protein FAM210B, mitochondrial-like n=1 Tax=Cygnus olor TaxID=8869 RepID=UPI001ADE26A9|nr:protein FAM210B, mitochondrial-like [Cygnus olor]